MRMDCERCASAGSVEFGMCQVCLAEHPRETRRHRPAEVLAPFRLPLETAASEVDPTRVALLAGHAAR